MSCHGIHFSSYVGIFFSQAVLQQPVQKILGDTDGATVGEIEISWSDGVKQHTDTVLGKLSAFKVGLQALFPCR